MFLGVLPLTDDATLPLVLSRTSHSKDDMLMECTRRNDMTHCRGSMLRVSLVNILPHVSLVPKNWELLQALQCCAGLC